MRERERERERERGWRCGGGGEGRQLSQLVEEVVVMMEEQLSPLAVAHLLQHTLRSLCTQEGSQWVYAVFWRILPRNYPPPKWDLQGGAFDRSRGNRRNWILVWEDGFCNFAASAGGCAAGSSSSTGYGGCVDDSLHMIKGLQPELFFKMSHEIYSYGEGLIGKVAADHSHKWVFKEGAPADNNDANSLSAWQNPTDSQPRTWEAQFQCGIQTIALIAVREGVVQLGAVNKVVEDLSYVVLLRKRFSYLESIPGVLLPHPSSSSAFLYPLGGAAEDLIHSSVAGPAPPTLQPAELYPLIGQQVIRAAVTPSMSSLEALLSKLPPVGPLPPPSLLPPAGYQQQLAAAAVNLWPAQSPGEVMGQLDRMEAKEEMDDIMYCVGSSEIRSMELGGAQGGWYIQHAAKPTDSLI